MQLDGILPVEAWNGDVLGLLRFSMRLVIRGLDLSPDDFASISRHFGVLGPVPAGREHAKLGPGGASLGCLGDSECSTRIITLQDPLQQT